jgi:hypothetical protein
MQMHFLKIVHSLKQLDDRIFLMYNKKHKTIGKYSASHNRP